LDRVRSSLGIGPHLLSSMTYRCSRQTVPAAIDGDDGFRSWKPFIVACLPDAAPALEGRQLY